MLLDKTLLFWHTGTAYAMTSGEYVSVASTSFTASATSDVIDLTNARDLGIGDGAERPKIAVMVGTAFTSSCTSLTVSALFQGSTDSSTWTTYAQTPAATTASWTAGAYVLPIDVPRRPTGVAIPRYYRMRLTVADPAGVSTISTGSLIGGIVLVRGEPDTIGSYPAGFSFPSAA